MGDAKPDVTYTALNGYPLSDVQASLKIGSFLQSPLLLRDINLIETIAHATEERVPERLVHAKGGGARGYFECTSDEIQKYTKADFLSQKGKKTDLRVRFSTVAGGRGSPDTVRDTRGFAFKMYTNEGNLDWLFFSEPVFPIRDGAKFPSFVHCQKGVPSTSLFDPNTFWDFMSANPETFHALLMIFTDRGTTAGYQFSEIFSLNTYTFIPPDGVYPPDGSPFYYVKIHLKPTLGVKNFTADEARYWIGQNVDYHNKILAEAIEDGKKTPSEAPAWDVFAQIITRNEAMKLKVNVFDPTKVVSQSDYPLIPFGKIVLTDNPDNYFEEVEQIGFSPTSIVPGWDVSEDPILQTRLFAYGNAQRYRIGTNFMQNRANAPKKFYDPVIRDGNGIMNNQGATPNYLPGNLANVNIKPIAPQYVPESANGQVIASISKFDAAVDNEQPRIFYEQTLDQGQKDALISNLADSIGKTNATIQARTIDVLTAISKELGARVADKIAHPNTQSALKNSHNHLL